MPPECYKSDYCFDSCLVFAEGCPLMVEINDYTRLWLSDYAGHYEEWQHDLKQSRESYIMEHAGGYY